MLKDIIRAARDVVQTSANTPQIAKLKALIDDVSELEASQIHVLSVTDWVRMHGHNFPKASFGFKENFEAQQWVNSKVADIQLKPAFVKTLQMLQKQYHRKQPTCGDEAEVRVILNHILAATLSAVKDLQQITDTRCLRIAAEKRLSYGPVITRVDERIVQGIMDYSVWYGTYEDTECNLVVCETGLMGCADELQVLGYMGIIQKLRQKLKKANTTVYGIITDLQFFNFLKLEPSGTFHVHRVRGPEGDLSIVVPIIASMILEAAKLSLPPGEECDPIQV